MKKPALITLGLIAAAVSVACDDTPTLQWVATTYDNPWGDRTAESIPSDKSGGAPDVVVDLSQKYQIIDGFGTCFNELGWTSLGLLDENDRQDILRDMFAPGVGANFTICRMPVGANDFSREWYSYDETPGDFDLQHFSIDNDLETLVPFIRNALEYNPALKVWASPWSPPTWMKYSGQYACAYNIDTHAPEFHNDVTVDLGDQEGTDMFIQQDEYFDAYARYFTRFIEAYRDRGIEIFMVMPQNEFNSCQVFPSCTWTPEGLARFIGGHLGPAMSSLGVAVMFGTMERPDPQMAYKVLDDPLAGPYLKGAGFQWAGKQSVGEVHRTRPDLKIYQTEQECGNGRNDWEYCVYAWGLMKHYLSSGANVYTYWNTSLVEGGVSRWGWSQNSLVSVDPATGTYRYNPEYYLIKHFSHFVLPGARRLGTTGGYEDVMAFENSDGSVVVVACNDSDEARVLNIDVAGHRLTPTLGARSFNTLVVR